MTIAHDHYREYLAEKLWQWIPAVYRELDTDEAGGALRAFIESLAVNATFLKRNDDRVWDDGFVELASDWAVPYIGDLVATRLVSALNLRARRVDVAKTIYYRRRTGTLAVLEQLIADITAWDGKVVEEFRRLARAHHGLDGVPRRGRVTGTPEGGFADLRSVRGALLAGGPFDEYHYTPDARRPRGLWGSRGIPKLSFHIYRLRAVPLVGVVPRRMINFPGTRDAFTFDPSGRDVSLFATDRTIPAGVHKPDAQGEWSGWKTAAEWQLPRRIPCRLLGEQVYEIGDAQIGWMRTTPLIPGQPQRDAAAADLRRIAGQRIPGRVMFVRLVSRLPAAAITTMPAVLQELLQRALVPDCGSAALLPNGADVASWPGPIVPAESSVRLPAISVHFAGGPIVPRSATRAARLDAWAPPVIAGVTQFIEPRRGRLLVDHAPFGTNAVRVDYHVGMLAPIGAGAYAREVEGPVPLTLWQNGAFGAGTPANGAAEIVDSVNYVDPPGQLAIVACSVRASEAERPYVILDAANWRLRSAVPTATLVLDGAWIGAQRARTVRLEGHFDRVGLRFMTFDPGGLDALGAALPAVVIVVVGVVEKLVIDRCILASVRLAGAASSLERLIIRDSIVQSRVRGVIPIDLPTARVRMARCTVIAPTLDATAMGVEELDATDSLVAGVARVTNTQAGCFRFSARGPGSAVPHPYRSHVLDDPARLFASTRFGDERYGQLGPVALPALVQGAENGSEIGAYCGAIVPIKRASLASKVDEYLPFGRIPNYVIDN
jgi:hypothetical protein